MDATYVYGLVQAKKAPALTRGPKGLRGAGRPRTLRLGPGLFVVVASAPHALYGEEAIDRGLKDMEWVSDCAQAHEAVVEHLSRAGAVIPMKLFTLFHDDERALEHLRRERPRLERVLARVAGCDEWGVRITFDAAAAAAAAPRSVERPSSGAAFLMRKKQQKDDRTERVLAARERAEALYRELADHALDGRRRPPLEGEGVRVVLDAAFLVSKAKARAFHAAVKKAQRSLDAGFELVLNGPWPPYNFIAEAA